jgi:hypothetical protein
MPYVDYDNLTITQKCEVEHLPWLHVSAERHRFAFWIKPDGHVSRRSGHKTITAAEGAKIDAMLNGEEIKSRTATENWKPGTTFHAAPEGGAIGWGRGMFIAGAAAGVTRYKKGDPR